MENASISYKNLRQVIGWLGVALPILVLTQSILVGDCNYLQDSFNHYNSTLSNTIYNGILWGLAIVLLFYPTYENDPKDEGTLTTIAGLCAIGVSVFPITPNSNSICTIFYWDESSLNAGIHNFCAGIMLLILSYISVSVFTRTGEGNNLRDNKHRWKVRRNYIYTTMGWITFLSVALIAMLTLLENDPDFSFTTKYIFWLEVSALLSFGISWIVKGGFVLTDDSDVSTIGNVKQLFTYDDYLINHEN